MATLIGDVFAESSRFHPIIRGPSLQHQRSHESHLPTRSVSRSRDRDVHSAHSTRSSAASPRRPPSAAGAATAGYRHPSQPHRSQEGVTPDAGAKALPSRQAAARFPSPPPSSSPSETSSDGARSQYASATYIVTACDQSTAGSSAMSSSSTSSTSTDATVVATSARPMPSPASDTGPARDASGRTPPSAGTPVALERPDSPAPVQMTIRVRDLAHIQSLAKADLLTAAGPGILNDPPLQQMRYEISGMPICDIIEMVAALLTKITTTNDLQHDALNRNAAHVKQAQAQARGEEAGGESNMSPLSSSVLAFHGKNVPAITILSYLSRIHKYCPTTYEVFLSLLVYFDRMTERVNDMVMKSEEARRQQQQQQAGAIPSRKSSHGATNADIVMRDSNSDETDSDLADDDDDQDGYNAAQGAGPRSQVGGSLTNAAQATYFVVDSFNIHRLIIAGVTCASKFFSDVFYTNSRYAKVGGLPLAELNHLELQFLLLNDFRLAVPVEDLEAYATMLVEFYAREVLAQRSRPVIGME